MANNRRGLPSRSLHGGELVTRQDVQLRGAACRLRAPGRGATARQGPRHALFLVRVAEHRPRAGPRTARWCSSISSATGSRRCVPGRTSPSACRTACWQRCCAISGSHDRTSSATTSVAPRCCAPTCWMAASTPACCSSTWSRSAPGAHPSCSNHEAAFAGAPGYVHRAILAAYLRGAVLRPLTDEELAPWLGEHGQSGFYRQIAQMDPRFTDEVEQRYGALPGGTAMG